MLGTKTSLAINIPGIIDLDKDRSEEKSHHNNAQKHNYTNLNQMAFKCSRIMDEYMISQALLIEAIASKQYLAEKRKGREFAKTGDVSKDDLKKKRKTIDEDSKILDELLEENDKPLNKKQKRLATAAAIRYVKAVKETVDLSSSLKDINLLSVLTCDLKNIPYLIKTLPKLAINGITTAGKIIKYLGANKVNTKSLQAIKLET